MDPFQFAYKASRGDLDLLFKLPLERTASRESKRMSQSVDSSSAYNSVELCTTQRINNVNLNTIQTSCNGSGISPNIDLSAAKYPDTSLK